MLSNSDIFVYNYVFESIGLLRYQIINDLDIVKNFLTEDNLIIMNWSSSCNYAYRQNDNIICNPLNVEIINQLKPKYILLVGDTDVSVHLKAPIYKYENWENVIFNYL